jgi:hypothetical protein
MAVTQHQRTPHAEGDPLDAQTHTPEEASE